MFNLFILTRMTRISTNYAARKNYHTKHLLCNERHESRPHGIREMCSRSRLREIDFSPNDSYNS